MTFLQHHGPHIQNFKKHIHGPPGFKAKLIFEYLHQIESKKNNLHG